MRQFLRYQISGMIFIFWLVIFYFGKDISEPIKLLEQINTNYKEDIGINSIIGLLSALPIGVIIHQISVEIKNLIIGKIFSEFDDFPNRERINSNSEMKTYILERISNLNSYYYVRFDNGLLAPFLVWFVVINIIDKPINKIWIILSIIIGLILSVYIYRIKKEIEEYNKILNVSSEEKSNSKKTKSYNITVNEI